MYCQSTSDNLWDITIILFSDIKRNSLIRVQPKRRILVIGLEPIIISSTKQKLERIKEIKP